MELLPFCHVFTFECMSLCFALFIYFLFTITSFPMTVQQYCVGSVGICPAYYVASAVPTQKWIPPK